MRVLFSAFGRARHATGPNVLYLRDQPRLALHSRVPLPLQADGEYLGEHTDVLIELVPEALGVLT
jgi:diacylglycerol kinase family enzyme